MIETLDCLEMFGIPEKFKGFEECQERCFLALRQLQRWKVKHFIETIKCFTCFIHVIYITFCLYYSTKCTVVHMFAILPTKEIKFISI